MVVRVLDLYSGTGSLAKALSLWPGSFKVTQVELNPDYALAAICDPPEALEKHIVADALTWSPEEAGPFDVVWASPPCRTYSRLQNRWSKTVQARELLMQAEGDPLVKRALAIIEETKPAVWFLENPLSGALSKRPFMQGVPYTDVSYCHYGSHSAPWPYRKDTRIWTNLQHWQGRVCKKDCPGIIDGRHPKGVIDIGPTIRGQIPPALMRALFSAACVQLRAMTASTSKKGAAANAQVADMLKAALMAEGIDEDTANVAMQRVDEIHAPQKTPKRTDLLIRIGSKRFRSISSAAEVLKGTFQIADSMQANKDTEQVAPEDFPPEHPTLDTVLESQEVITASQPAPAPVLASEGGKEMHFHFHISLPALPIARQ